MQAVTYHFTKTESTMNFFQESFQSFQESFISLRVITVVPRYIYNIIC